MCARLLRPLILCVLIFIVSQSDSALGSDKLMFIVNEKNPIKSLSVNELRDYYFKRRRSWPNGVSVRFIDAGEGTAALKRFQSEYLKRSQKDINLYWIGQKLYSGDSAPLREPSEATIVQFVASLPGGIGYITDRSLIDGKAVREIQVDAGGK
ncbi:MAG TPA: hypothetical protein VM432_02625 [Bdellovibrionales bacterium]|jgi:ABC-type phosphate transport system substrate-binding protein|nr:hypothetical protein [Bdellovibrionales bacterium]